MFFLTENCWQLSHWYDYKEPYTNTHTQSRNNLKSFKSWVSIANLLWQLPAKHYGNIHCVRVLDYWANIWPMSEAKMCVWHWVYGVRMVLSARFMWLKWLTRYAQFEFTHTRVLWYPIRVAYYMQIILYNFSFSCNAWLSHDVWEGNSPERGKREKGRENNPP